MANSDSSPIGAKEIGTFFVRQYYEMLQKDPSYACRFYNEGSRLVVADRHRSGSMEIATTLKSINDILTTIDFEAVVIEDINAVNSWNGGIHVLISGGMDSKVQVGGVSLGVRKKFVQSVFLAPQNKGYFVESDLVQYLGQHPEEYSEASSVEGSEQGKEDTQEPAKTLEAEAISVVHVEISDADHSSDKYVIEHHSEPETVTEAVLQEPVVEPTPATQQSDILPAPQSVPAVEEPVGEPPKFSYASMVLKGTPKTAASILPSQVKKTPPPAVQQSKPKSVASRPVSASSRPASVASDGAEGDSGKGESVYLKNLAPGSTRPEVRQTFKQFGKIKEDGVYVKTSPDGTFCFGFVDFADNKSAQNAVKASPLMLGGQPVYIEFKKAGTSPSGPPPRGEARAGGRGRGGRGSRGSTNERY